MINLLVALTVSSLSPTFDDINALADRIALRYICHTTLDWDIDKMTLHRLMLREMISEDEAMEVVGFAVEPAMARRWELGCKNEGR